MLVFSLKIKEAAFEPRQTSLFCVKKVDAALRGALDIDARHGRLLQLLVEELADREVLMQKLAKLATHCVPARTPVFRQREAEPDRMAFLAHDFLCGESPAVYSVLLVTQDNSHMSCTLPYEGAGSARSEGAALESRAGAGDGLGHAKRIARKACVGLGIGDRGTQRLAHQASGFPGNRVHHFHGPPHGQPLNLQRNLPHLPRGDPRILHDRHHFHF